VAISVMDDGLGMPAELAAAPFEPARRPRPSTSNGPGTGDGTSASTSNGRANGSSRKSAGAGLGLSIAKGIVQAHGGRLELTALRKGTCFSVYLPVEAEEAVRTATSRGPNHSDSTDHPKGPRDDSDD
jgi:signal transduction histidine kinase